jgi:hypothetical protein
MPQAQVKVNSLTVGGHLTLVFNELITLAEKT